MDLDVADEMKRVTSVFVFLLTLAALGAAQNSGTFGIGDAVTSLSDIGFFTYAAPFLLMFAIVFGLVSKLEIFENDRVTGIVAVAAGLFTVAAIAGTGGVASDSLVTNLNVFLIEFFGAFAVVAVGLLAVVMAASIGGYTEGSWAWSEEGYPKKAFFVLGGLAALTIFISWGGWEYLQVGEAQSTLSGVSIFSTSLFISLLIILAVLGLIYWVTGGEGGGGGGAEEQG